MSEDFTREETSLGKGWDTAGKVMEERAAGFFLKVEDGKSVFLNVVSEPEVYERAFNPGDEPRARVKVDVFVPGEDKLKTWDMSNTVWKQLRRQKARRGKEFDRAVFELGREGTEKQTKYWLEYARDLDPDELKARDALIPF